MPKLPAILEKLKRTQRAFVLAADAVPDDCWNMAPRTGCWSAAEVVAHVIMVERAVMDAVVRIVKKEPRKIALHQRIRLPLAFVEFRMVRIKSPIPLDPRLLREKPAMLRELQEVRENTLKRIEETRDRDLSVYSWRHPVVGYLTVYEWFALLGSHQIRHEKQMKEIAQCLPKAIANLQK